MEKNIKFPFGYFLFLLIFGLSLNCYGYQGLESLQLQKQHKERMDFNKKRLDEMQNKLQMIGRILATKEGKLASLNNAKFDQELEMGELENKLKVLQSDVAIKQNKISRLIKVLVAQRASSESSMSMIIIEKTIRETIANLDNHLKSNEQQMIHFKSKILVITQNLQNFIDLENSLADQLKELKETRTETIAEMSEIEKKIDELLKIKLVENSVFDSAKTGNFTVIMPLESFNKSITVKKGITLHYQDSVAILSPANGRVAYLGQLGNLGDVVIIDHGQDYRSILLGKAMYTVRTADEVRKGDVIGHVRKSENAAGVGQIYFEVRYKNVSQRVTNFIQSSQHPKGVPANADVAGALAGDVNLNNFKSVR